jgi:hypothetical protein
MMLVDKRPERNGIRRQSHAVNAFGIGEPLQNAEKRHQRAENDYEQNNFFQPLRGVDKRQSRREKNKIDAQLDDGKARRIRVERKRSGGGNRKRSGGDIRRAKRKQLD